MESKLLVGGKTILDKTTEQERALEQRKKEILEQKVAINFFLISIFQAIHALFQSIQASFLKMQGIILLPLRISINLTGSVKSVSLFLEHSSYSI